MPTGLIFDAAGSNPDGTDPGTALGVFYNDSYVTLLDGLSWPAPQPTVQWATSADTEGSSPAAVKHENRQINLTILCKTATALTNLEAKLMKIQREQGTLQWTLPDGSTKIIFDLLSVDSYDPAFNEGIYSATGGAYCKVQIQMTAKPYGRGTEVTTLSDHVETTLPMLVFTEASIAGDLPALGRLVIDNDEASSMQWVAWGIQQRYYSAASTAALFYQAESCALESGASLVVGPAGASGAGSNVVFFGTLTAAMSPIVFLGASSTAQTHIGSFRVFARVYAPNTNTGTVSLRADWSPYVNGTTISNDAVSLSTTSGGALENQWAMVDLGLVTPAKARIGSQGWIGNVSASSTVANDDINIDWIALVPAGEGYGEAYASSPLGSPVASSGHSVQARYDGVLQQDSSGSFWRTPDIFEGRYVTIPPSGLESRTLRVITRFSAHVPLSANRSPASVVADVVGDVSAKLFVTPRYLVVPSP